MRPVIYGKDQQKLVLDLSEVHIHHGASFNYEVCFFRKKRCLFCTGWACADLTEHHHNMELKVFRNVLFLVSKYFYDLIAWK